MNHKNQGLVNNHINNETKLFQFTTWKDDKGVVDKLITWLK